MSQTLLMSACCCGEILCPQWQQCRPQSVSFNLDGALANGFRDDGFTMRSAVLNWSMAIQYLTSFSPAPTTISVGFSITDYTYTSGGLVVDPDCPPCKSRALASTITGSANSAVVTSTGGGFGVSHGITCLDPCFGLGSRVFSRLGVRLLMPMSWTRTIYVNGFPSITNGSSNAILSLSFIGREGCLVPQTWDDYRVEAARLEMTIAGQFTVVESDPDFFNRCDCSTGCLPTAYECVGLGTLNDARVNFATGWNRESCTEDFCNEQICFDPNNGAAISVCGCRLDDPAYAPLPGNFDGLALRRYFEDLETSVVMTIP